MKNILLPCLLIAALPLVAGCVADVDSGEATESVSQAIVPPPGGGCDDFVTRTQGFWQNHTCVVKGDATGYSMVPVVLGNALRFDKPADVTAYFDQPTKGDKQIILGHQLLAAKLNVAAFGIGDFEFVDGDGNGTIDTVSELIAMGDAAFDSGTSTQRAKMGTILDKLNNAGDQAALWFDPVCSKPPTPCQ